MRMSRPVTCRAAFDYLQNRITVARAEIQEIRFTAAAQMPKRTNVRVGKIRYVHVVANRGAVRRRIVSCRKPALQARLLARPPGRSGSGAIPAHDVRRTFPWRRRH